MVKKLLLLEGSILILIRERNLGAIKDFFVFIIM